MSVEILLNHSDIETAGAYNMLLKLQNILTFLFCLTVLINGVKSDCLPSSGPAGRIDCVFTTATSSFQLSACVTNSYLSEKSFNRLSCSVDGEQYCYISCMAELGLTGPVTSRCRCAEGASPTQSSLSQSCLAPTGQDCTWYTSCLAAQYPCTGQAGVAELYGQAFCNLTSQPPPEASSTVINWANAVNKCFQVQLTPVLRSYSLEASCSSLQDRISQTFRPCYLNNSGGLKLCDLTCKDFSYIFFTLKSQFSDEYVALLRDFYDSMVDCSHGSGGVENLCGYQCSVFYGQQGVVDENCVKAATFEISFKNNNVEDLVVDDELANSIAQKISSLLNWNTGTSVRWYAIASEASGSEVSVQLFLVDIAELGLIDRESLSSLVDVVNQLSDNITAGLIVDIQSSVQLTAQTLSLCNPYGQTSASCSRGQLIASLSGLSSVPGSTVQGSTTAGFRRSTRPGKETPSKNPPSVSTELLTMPTLSNTLSPSTLSQILGLTSTTLAGESTESSEPEFRSTNIQTTLSRGRATPVNTASTTKGFGAISRGHGTPPKSSTSGLGFGSSATSQNSFSESLSDKITNQPFTPSQNSHGRFTPTNTISTVGISIRVSQTRQTKTVITPPSTRPSLGPEK